MVSGTRASCPNPENFEHVALAWQGGLADVVNFRILSWEIILYYLDEPSVTTGVLMRGGQEGQGQISKHGDGSESQREKLEEAMLLALKMEEGARSQGIWVASNS